MHVHCILLNVYEVIRINKPTNCSMNKINHDYHIWQRLVCFFMEMVIHSMKEYLKCHIFKNIFQMLTLNNI